MANKKHNTHKDDVITGTVIGSATSLVEVIGSATSLVEEPVSEYGVTIPVTVPTMGGYTIDALRDELTEFARKLVSAQNVTTEKVQHISWRTMPISDKVKKMSLGKSDLSTDNRTVKQMLEKSLQEKYV